MNLRTTAVYAAPLLALIAIGFGLYLAMSDSGGSGPQGGPAGLLVLGDVQLRHALEAPDIEHESGVIGRFQRRFGAQVSAEYGTSRELLVRLASDREADVFMLTDEDAIQRALDSGLVEHLRDVAWLVPVILVREGNPGNITTVADLEQPDLRLAVVNDRSEGIGRTVAHLFARHGVPLVALDEAHYTADSVDELAIGIAMDRADAAIVWNATARQYPRNVETITIPAEFNLASRVVAGVSSMSANKELARSLVDFMSGPAGLELFEMYGFAPPDGAP